jgi:hypothetical protein
LDKSKQETLKSVKQWNPAVLDLIAAIRQEMKEEVSS